MNPGAIEMASAHVGRTRNVECGMRNASRGFNIPHSRVPPGCRNPHLRGLSLIEVVASTMIVGMMCVAALNSLGAATRSSESIGNRAVAIGLADDLMSEILQKPYKDSTSPIFGPEPGEVDPTDFDDVDDYNGWSEQPPLTREDDDSDGEFDAMEDRDNWLREVEILRVAPGNLLQSVGTDQGAKRIRVTVKYQNHGQWLVLAEQIAIRSDID
jgi:type II secretory pathway pseudopilin PulG